MRNPLPDGSYLFGMISSILILATSCVTHSHLHTFRLESGDPALSVTIAPEATEPVRDAAADLALYLGRILGQTVPVVEGDGTTGIAVGLSTDFPALPGNEAFDGADPLRREEYRLQSHNHGIRAIGATELAVSHAVWDLLYRMGYRQFFPEETWEIVPRKPAIDLALDVFEKPAYHARRIWYGHGVRPERREGYRNWLARNRVARGFTLYSGHAYDGIIRANADAFREHPEYYALIDGERRLAGRVDGGGNIKFCISNPGLRQLVAEHAVNVMQTHPERDSLSMDPSDGGNWCECGPCTEMGSISDRVLILANQVAEAINELELGPKYVGIYAYGYHSPPPSIDVHPNVIVSATAGFLRGGYTLDEIIEGWQARGAVMGIYDYFSVMPWDWDLPGRPRASSPAYMAETLPRFYDMGIRFHDAESSDNWGPNGLGYYIASRILWDLNEADRIEELVDDFLMRAFGPAAEPMREFYRLIDRENRPMLSENLVGRMYRALDEALTTSAADDAVQRRLLDLALYTRYVELWLSEDMESRVRHAHRIRDTGMVHFRALWARQRRRLEMETIPDEWRNDHEYTREETLALIRQGIETNEIFSFEPVTYSDELVPVTPLDLPEVPPGHFGILYRGGTGVQGGIDAYTWFDVPGTLELQVAGGLIPHYRDRGNVRISLFSPQEITLEPVAFDDQVPPDGEPRLVTLATPYTGLHKLELRDGGDASNIVWPEDWPVTVSCAPDARRLPLRGDWTLYFYVPRGTSRVAGFTDNARGSIEDADGNEALRFADISIPGYFDVPVPEGQDGRLWKITGHASRRLQLLTVPPYLARSEKELLLPREIVAADTD